MNWNSAAEFFAMGGYGLYVWGAYAVTAACMLSSRLWRCGIGRPRRSLAKGPA